MDKHKKKQIKRIVSGLLAAALVLFLAVMPLMAKQKTKEEEHRASILSAAATAGEVNRKIVGGGTLSEEDTLAIQLPATVRLKEFLATNGQSLKKGDAVAAVDLVTVMTSITEIQDTLELLSEEIEKESKASTSEDVVALAGGTVKLLYATVGDSVQSVMLEHGALAILSLDGLMAVDLTVDSPLSAGSAVSVTLANGTVTEGKIASNLSDSVTVTVEDQGYGIGDSVQISTADGEALGAGSLYIYSPWSASAYTGTVSRVKVSQGEKVSAGESLMTLTDMGSTARYQKLLSQRQEYEALMLELFQMYQSRQVSAPADGILSGIDPKSPLLLASTDSLSPTLLANSPNGDDVTLFKTYVARVGAIGQNGWALQIDPKALSIEDYKALPENLAENAAMTDVVIYNPDGTQVIPIYELSGEEWQALQKSDVSTGDTLLLAETEQGDPVWIVRIQRASAESQSPSQPEGGSTDTPLPEGSDSTLPQTPSVDTAEKAEDSSSIRDKVVQSPSSGSGSIGGNWNGAGATSPQESAPEEELFDASLTQIAAITPQNTMALEIAVDQLDVKSISPGMEAQIKINALGGLKLTATVTDVGGVGTNNGGSSKFTVKLSMPREENMLAGMNATATLIPETNSQTLLLPVKALVDQGTKTYVYTAYDEKQEKLLNPIEVTLGASDGENVQILEGLKEGDTYYYAYYDTAEVSLTPDFGTKGFQMGRR